MRDLYSRTQPISIWYLSDRNDRQSSEPIRTLAIVTRGDYDRPTGPVDTGCHVRELGTFAPGPRLELKPRRDRGLRGLIAYLLRLHP